MITTDYENTYVSVQKARWEVADLDLVMEILSKASEPMTCHDIGFAIWGAGYLDNHRSAAHMGQMLRHLRQGKFIRMEEVKGEPFEVEYEEWVNNVLPDENGNLPTLKVHDDAGNEYTIPNPKYRGRLYYNGGHFEKVKKTITPRIKVYSLVR